MNSFYGVLGTPACRFHDVRLANAITGFGRELLLFCRARIEAGGRHVLYGDTDSLFVETGTADPAAARATGAALAEALDRELARQIAERQLRAVAEPVLALLGQDFDDVSGKGRQLSLF